MAYRFLRIWLLALGIATGMVSGGQTISIWESYLILNPKGAGNTFYDLQASTGNPDFQGVNLGTFSSAETLVLAGAQIKTNKCSGGNVTGGNLYYRVYPVSSIPGSFGSAIGLGWVSDDGGTCGGDQTWQVSSGTVDVKNGLAAGVYFLEVYTEATGSPSTVYSYNGGANYRAIFSVTVTSIAQLDFDVMNTLGYMNSGGTSYNGLSASGDRPASTTFSMSSSTGFGLSNGTSTVTLNNVSGLLGYSNKKFKVKLASFSINSTANGADAADNVMFSVSLDGGASWSDEITVSGNNNAYWSFAGGTGLASTIFDGDNSPNSFAPAGGGSRTSDGYSSVQIDLPNICTQAQLKIVMFNNNTNERWVIDDIQLIGEVIPGPTLNIESPVGTTISIGGSRSSFGSLVVNTNNDFTIRLRNIGTVNSLSVSNLAIGGANAGDFTIVSPPSFPFTVGTISYQDLTLRAKPTATGARTGTFTVTSNDGTNATYSINLSAAAIASTSSDIIDNSSFSSASPDLNINTPYISCLDGTNTTNGKSIAMKFKIRDGGSTANDADNLATVLTDLKFTVKNTGGTDRISFIKAAILTTELGTVIGSGSIVGSEIVFTGLTDASFTVADDIASASNIHLRVSFNEANVIDNEKLVYQVSSATASTSGSGFAAVNAGGAQTNNATSNDQNRIEVVADRLAFGTQPVSTGFGQTMSPAPTVKAVDVNNRTDLDFGNVISIGSTGTMTGTSLSANAVSGIATFSNIVHTALGTGLALNATSTITGATSNPFDITATSGTTDYYRSKQSGNWADPNSWQSSPDNSTWFDATLAPNSTANTITLQNGHNIAVNSTINLDQTTISSGATLRLITGGAITVFNGTGDDLIIESGGTYLHQDNVAAPTINSGVSWRVKTSAIIQVNNNSSGDADYYANSESANYSNAMVWENGSIFIWNTSNAFSNSGITYFPTASASVIPIFRLAVNIGTALGGGSATVFNGLFESNGTNSWGNSGSKTFRNGIIGTATITQNALCGQFLINGNTSQIGGSGTLILDANGLSISAGSCSLSSSKTINNGPVSVSSGATLDALSYTFSGSAGFTLNSGATLITAHTSGVNGSIAVSGTKTFYSGSNYTFNGSVNQATGTQMASTVGSLVINNSGTPSSNFVTLSNNNTQATTLNLQAGLFGTGAGNTIRIATGGTVNGTGGHISTNSNGEGGTIEFLANGAVTGTPNLWNVTIGNSAGGVDFTNNATIYSLFTINNQGSVNPNAPRYASGSTLMYNAGGSYNRSVEWGNTSGQPGYPHHVVVQNGTTLNLGAAVPAALETGGDLTLGNSSSAGYANMGALAIPLVVRGNLTIGTGSVNNSILSLSTAYGGDLWLYGNFERYNGSTFTDNERAIFFKGSANSSVNVNNTPPATPGNPTLQDFKYAIIDKDNPTNSVSLNIPTGILKMLTLTKGLVSAISYPLYIKNDVPDATNDGISGGDANSYVDGTLYRYTSSSVTGSYSFPVGKSASSKYRPLRFISTVAGGSLFMAEYYYGTNTTPGANDNFLSMITGILKDEYWKFNRTSGTTNGKLVFLYQYPGAGNFWRDAAGTLMSPCSNCNVAVVKRDSELDTGNWTFTKANNTFDEYSTLPETRFHTQSGYIVSGELSSFSPFTLGFAFNTILGVLPVRLLSFSGKPVGRDAQLRWKIENDKDLRHFELEHSTDGVHFSTLAKIASGGLQYQYNHIPAGYGKHYYRLLTVEKNGATSQSAIVQISFQPITGTYVVRLLPTLIQQQAILKLWSASAQGAETIITDAIGRQQEIRRITLNAGSNQLLLQMPTIPPGVYYLTLRTGDGFVHTVRFLKQ